MDGNLPEKIMSQRTHDAIITLLCQNDVATSFWHNNGVSFASYVSNGVPRVVQDHYNNVIMRAMASQITSLTIVYSIVYSRRRLKKASKLRVTGLCEGNSPVIGEFPAQRASYAQNVSIWWRHLVLVFYVADVVSHCRDANGGCQHICHSTPRHAVCSCHVGYELAADGLACEGEYSWNMHDDVIKWKHFARYWPFVWGIHRWPVNSPHKGQRRRALVFSLICAWINGWWNIHEAGDLRRHYTHYDVTVMLATEVLIVYQNEFLTQDYC